MTRDIIITSISNNDNLKAYARKLASGNDLWNDMWSELLLFLYEMPEDRFVSIYQSEGLVGYCNRVLYFSWNSTTSPFYKKYRMEERDKICDLTPLLNNQDTYNGIRDRFSKQLEFDPIDTESEYDPEIDILYNKCQDQICKLTEEISKKRYPTEPNIFDIYLSCGSYRKTAKQLRLPVMTVYNIINGFKDKIKEGL